MAFNRTLQHFTSSQELATVWETGKDYIENQLVLESDRLYRCSTAHTSGATFAGDSGNWAVVKPGEIIQIADGGTGEVTASDAFDALSPTTTKGDIIVRDGSSNTRLAAGSYGQTLIADSTEPTGLKWVTPQQGTKNYITSGTFESGTDSGWSLANSTLNTIKLPNQAQGSWVSSSSLTKSISSSEKLAGAYSLKLSASVAAAAGDMLVTDAIDLDLEAQASVQTFSFYYKVISGDGNLDFSGTSSNTLGVAIYVVDGTLAGTWIQPAGVFNLVQKTGVGKASGTFQVPSDATQLRLAIYCANASAGSFEILLDDFVLGPQAVQYGAPITDWQDYDSVIGGATALTNSAFKYRRVGDKMEIEGSLLFSGAATARISVSIPSGYSIDTTKLPYGITGAQSYEMLGRAVARDSSPVGYINGLITRDVTSSTDLIFITAGDDSAINQTWDQTRPFTWASGDAIVFSASVPIQGWSSSVEMSNDTDTRVVGFIAYNTAATAFTSGNKVPFPTVEKDTHASWNGTDTYTIPVSGFYEVKTAFITSQTAASAITDYYGYQLFIDGTRKLDVVASYAATTGSVRKVGFGSSQFYATAGQQIDLRFTTTGAAHTLNASIYDNYISITRVSGPATIAASESVIARYKCTTADTTSATDPINYDTKDIDTHGSVTTGAAWKFTAPISGRYLVSVSQAAATATSNTIYIYINGSGSRILAQGSANIAYSGSDVVALNAGDYIDIRNGSGTVLTLTNDSTINHIAIERLDR